MFFKRFEDDDKAYRGPFQDLRSKQILEIHKRKSNEHTKSGIGAFTSNICFISLVRTVILGLILEFYRSKKRLSNKMVIM